MKTNFTIAPQNIFHRTPVVWNWISIFLVGYATYQPFLMDWVHSAPFGSDQGKDLVMAWFDWLCPFLGVLIQFTRQKPQETPEAGHEG